MTCHLGQQSSISDWARFTKAIAYVRQVRGTSFSCCAILATSAVEPREADGTWQARFAAVQISPIDLPQGGARLRRAFTPRRSPRRRMLLCASPNNSRWRTQALIIRVAPLLCARPRGTPPGASQPGRLNPQCRAVARRCRGTGFHANPIAIGFTQNRCTEGRQIRSSRKCTTVEGDMK